MINTLLLDNDGVLVDTEQWYFRANQETLASIGIDFTEEDFVERLLKNSQGLQYVLKINGYNKEFTDKMLMKRNTLYSKFLSNEEIEVPGAAEFLEAVSSRYKICIVTSSVRHHFDLIHSRTGFTQHFVHVVAHGDYQKSKPAPDPYLTAMELCGASPSSCLAIEDSPRGLAAAKEAGLNCWIIRSRFSAGLDFSAADEVLDSIEEAQAKVLQL